jgi:hypothetical protein
MKRDKVAGCGDEEDLQQDSDHPQDEGWKGDLGNVDSEGRCFTVSCGQRKHVDRCRGAFAGG